MAEYDADVVSALQGVQLTEQQATALAKKIKTHNIKLAVISGLTNENVIEITTVMNEQAPLRNARVKFVALIIINEILSFPLHSLIPSLALARCRALAQP